MLGIEVDVVPFGGNETDRSVTFTDGAVFDATGIAEAHSTPVVVRMPQGTEVRVASPAALTALKILAWNERHADNPKDAVDLGTIRARPLTHLSARARLLRARPAPRLLPPDLAR